MNTIRRADERGYADHGWLRTYHTFSFANYYDPAYMGFRSLRVINEDRVQQGMGFPTHPHKDMEIISYVISGALEHEDSVRNGSVILPGDVQRMSAGTGITHSEFNHSSKDPVHFLQIWLDPSVNGITPSYEQKNFPVADKKGVLRLIASSNGEDGSVTIHQDARVYASFLDSGDRINYAISSERHIWVQLISGIVQINGDTLSSGDGIAISNEHQIDITCKEATEFLLFDLA